MHYIFAASVTSLGSLLYTISALFLKTLFWEAYTIFTSGGIPSTVSNITEAVADLVSLLMTTAISYVGFDALGSISKSVFNSQTPDVTFTAPAIEKEVLGNFTGINMCVVRVTERNNTGCYSDWRRDVLIVEVFVAIEVECF